MTSEQIEKLSFQIINMMPDDPRMALTVLALTMANVTVSSHASDEQALNAFRAALRQMRASPHWREN